MSPTYTAEFKSQVLREVQETGNASLVARRHQVKPETVRRWVREAKRETHPDPDALSLADENERLKRLLGEKDLQIAMLQDLLKKKGIRP
ncbi:transposase [Sulfobacillus harzensis]|uniref:Transposase n=1 Tax=Sulfobacillus harzensis TaxID=2729629 RepID=A0A7Y0L887_9FIRM|nr:transposase [Sulfobacillus harzensis]NMP24996.1 transposase [Sulfobacillus harzensis]